LWGPARARAESPCSSAESRSGWQHGVGPGPLGQPVAASASGTVTARRRCGTPAPPRRPAAPGGAQGLAGGPVPGCRRAGVTVPASGPVGPAPPAGPPGRDQKFLSLWPVRYSGPARRSAKLNMARIQIK
jgi:hypothetical protein